MNQSNTTSTRSMTFLEDSASTLLGRSKLNTTLTKLLVAIWTIIGLVILFLPYYLKLLDPLLQTMFSVFGSFVLSSAALGAVNTYFLRQAQMDETKSVLAESMNSLKSDFNASLFSVFDWVGNIDKAGIRAVYEGIPRERIKTAIKQSHDGYIRFLFLSYAVINEHEKAFKQAIEQGCTIEILVADPIKNCIIEFSESSSSHKKNRERQYADMCIANLKRIRATLTEDCQDRFITKTYTCSPSIVVVEVLDVFWFGILWSHDESFHGPWFEVQGRDKLLSKWLDAHLNSLSKLE